MVDRRFDMRLNMGWVVPLFSRYHSEMVYINGGYTSLGQVVYSNPGFSPSEVGIVCEGYKEKKHITKVVQQSTEAIR